MQNKEIKRLWLEIKLKDRKDKIRPNISRKEDIEEGNRENGGYHLKQQRTISQSWWKISPPTQEVQQRWSRANKNKLTTTWLYEIVRDLKAAKEKG